MKNKKTVMRGTYSIGIAAIAVCVVIVLNIFVGMLPEDSRKIHTNPEKMPVISAETKNILNSRDTEVTIYHLFSENATGLDENGEEISIPADENLINLLEQYEKASDKITVKTIDPVAYPDFVAKYATDTPGQSSVIVESDYRAKFISSVDLYRLTFSEYFPGEYFKYEEAYNLYNTYYNYGYSLIPDEEYYFFGENELTRAIDYVTRETLPTVYALSGHAETSLKDGRYNTFLAEENAELLTLSTEEGKDFAVPENADLIIINTPLQDITAAEKDALIAYLDKGGQIILTTVDEYYSAEKTPNLAALCAHMGLEGSDGLVAESVDATTSENGLGYYQYIDQIIPAVSNEGILKDLFTEGGALYFTSAHALNAITDKENVKTTPLLKTTENAYIYTQEISAAVEETIQNSKTQEEMTAATDAIVKEAPKSEFVLAYQSVLTNSEGKESGKFYWFSTPYFFDDNSFGYGNTTIFGAIMMETCDTEESVSLIGKPVEQDPKLEVSESAKTTWVIVLMVVLPLAALVPGVIFWASRRRK